MTSADRRSLARGDAVRRQRLALELTHEEVALELNRRGLLRPTRCTVSMWEAGYPITPLQLAHLAEVLGVPADLLAAGDGDLGLDRRAA